jgi:hypothetical protein
MPSGTWCVAVLITNDTFRPRCARVQRAWLPAGATHSPSAIPAARCREMPTFLGDAGRWCGISSETRSPHQSARTPGA